MKTLLRQKVCKITHNFLTTKHLTKENKGKKQEKRFNNLGAISRYPRYMVACSYRG
jgi:hypothetical protein